MRALYLNVYHCSASRPGSKTTVDTIRSGHKARGFNDIGYHFIVDLDGTVHKGRDITRAGAHAEGYNSNSIGICYIGGLDDKTGKPADTRTLEQMISLKALDQILKIIYPTITKSVGHRDLSVDLNGDGVISKNEWMKSCPCFDVKTEL